MSESTGTSRQSNVAEYTVTELSGALKRTVEDRFGMVRVRGEISGYRGPHSSGHSYFALKDDRSRLEAVIWRGVASRLKHLPEEGLEVIATGKLTTYPGSSKYQIVIDSIEPAGVGALMALLEERRKKLEAEGLFAPERKQLLPYMPRTIGVVTSPTGAVIRDILHRIRDRFPVRVIVWPVRVQGDTCGTEVANAVNGFNQLTFANGGIRPDLLIVARGGGSIEDLWGFNDEAAVRAVADSDIPVISAVGHETDWTLIDHAADVRAPTPTGAAEMAVPVRSELDATQASLKDRLLKSIRREMDRRRTDLLAANRGLPDLNELLAMPQQRLDELSGRLPRALTSIVRLKRNQYQEVSSRADIDPAQAVKVANLRLKSITDGLDLRFRSNVEQQRNRLGLLLPRLSTTSIARRITVQLDVLSGLKQRAHLAQTSQFNHWRARLNQAARLVGSLSHTSVLARGYAYLTDAGSNPIMNASDVKSGSSFTVHMHDGEIAAVSTGKSQSAPKQRQKPPADEKSGQGDLF